MVSSRTNFESLALKVVLVDNIEGLSSARASLVDYQIFVIALPNSAVGKAITKIL